MKQIIYVATAVSQQIEIWKLNNDWSLTLLKKINLYGEPQPILISNTKKRLYVGIRPNFCIYSYKIQSDGILKHKSYTTLPSSSNNLELDKEEKFIFSSSYHFNCIHICPLNLEGIPLAPIKTINNIMGCHASKMDYTNQYLFISALKEDRIYIYDFKNQEKLLKNELEFVQVAELSGPRHLEIQKSTDRLFSINELNGTLDIWKITRKNIKKLKFLKRICFIPPSNCKKNAWAADLHISPCEKYLYTSDRSKHLITILKLNNNVNNIENIAQVITENQPRSFLINTKGNSLITLGEKSNSMSIYKISKRTGLLTFKNKYFTGLRPIWISSCQI